jgi:hypothetical protein
MLLRGKAFLKIVRRAPTTGLSRMKQLNQKQRIVAEKGSNSYGGVPQDGPATLMSLSWSKTKMRRGSGADVTAGLWLQLALSAFSN